MKRFTNAGASVDGLEFVVKTTALVGMFDEIKDELGESGWEIDRDIR
jgi:hypothetical protein